MGGLAADGGQAHPSNTGCVGGKTCACARAFYTHGGLAARTRRRKLITETARELQRSQMARFDEKSGNLYVTGGWLLLQEVSWLCRFGGLGG